MSKICDRVYTVILRRLMAIHGWKIIPQKGRTPILQKEARGIVYRLCFSFEYRRIYILLEEGYPCVEFQVSIDFNCSRIQAIRSLLRLNKAPAKWYDTAVQCGGSTQYYKLYKGAE